LGVEGCGADELCEVVAVGAELCAELREGTEGASGEAGFEELGRLVEEGEVVLDVCAGWPWVSVCGWAGARKRRDALKRRVARSEAGRGAGSAAVVVVAAAGAAAAEGVAMTMCCSAGGLACCSTWLCGVERRGGADASSSSPPAASSPSSTSSASDRAAMTRLLVRACLAATAAASFAHAALSLTDGKLSVVDSALASAVASSSFVQLPLPLVQPAVTDPSISTQLLVRLAEPARPARPHRHGPPQALVHPPPGRRSLHPAAGRRHRPARQQGGSGARQGLAGLGKGPLGVGQGSLGARASSSLSLVQLHGLARPDHTPHRLQDLAHAPAQLLSLASFAPLDLTLVVGHPHESPLVLPLATVTLPASLALAFPFPPDSALPPHWEAERYQRMPDLEWTFRTPDKRVGKPVALVGLAVVLAPWALLFVTVRVSLSSRAPWRCGGAGRSISTSR